VSRSNLAHSHRPGIAPDEPVARETHPASLRPALSDSRALPAPHANSRHIAVIQDGWRYSGPPREQFELSRAQDCSPGRLAPMPRRKACQWRRNSRRCRLGSSSAKCLHCSNVVVRVHMRELAAAKPLLAHSARHKRSRWLASQAARRMPTRPPQRVAAAEDVRRSAHLQSIQSITRELPPYDSLDVHVSQEHHEVALGPPLAGMCSTGPLRGALTAPHPGVGVGAVQAASKTPFHSVILGYDSVISSMTQTSSR